MNKKPTTNESSFECAICGEQGMRREIPVLVNANLSCTELETIHVYLCGPHSIELFEVDSEGNETDHANMLNDDRRIYGFSV